jgi:hypothetical protein
MKTQPFDFEEVIDSLMIEESKPDHAALTRWIELYPQFARELTEFFAEWAMQAERSDEVDVDTERLSNIAVSHAMELLHRRGTSKGSTAKINAVRLLNAIAAMGKTATSVASALELDSELLKKLDLRRLTEVPKRLCEAASEHLSMSAEAIRNMVAGGPPIVNATAHHKAKGRLSLTTETFAHAIEHSSLPDDKKAYWATIIEAEMGKSNK